MSVKSRLAPPASDPPRPIDELDEVTLGAPVLSDAGETVPIGATGTVVAIWGTGESFEVEFSEPFHALATVDRSAIAQSRRAAA